MSLKNKKYSLLWEKIKAREHKHFQRKKDSIIIKINELSKNTDQKNEIQNEKVKNEIQNEKEKNGTLT